MTTKVELDMWAKLDAARKEEAEIEAAAKPLVEERTKICRERNQINLKALELSKQIEEIRFPRLREVRKEIGMFSRALNGKKRPQKEGSE